MKMQIKHHPKRSSQQNQSVADAVAPLWVFLAEVQSDTDQKRCLEYEELIKRALKWCSNSQFSNSQFPEHKVALSP